MCAQGIERAAQRAGTAGTGDDERAAALDTLLHTLGVLDRGLRVQPFLIGNQITVADAELCVALVQLDTVHRHHLDASAVQRIAGHPVLWACARRPPQHIPLAPPRSRRTPPKR